MCVKANRNNFFSYDKEKMNSINQAQLPKLEKTNSIKFEKQIESNIDTSSNLNSKKIATAQFNPIGVNFGSSIFSKELSNINEISKKNSIKNNNFNLPKNFKTNNYEFNIDVNNSKKLSKEVSYTEYKSKPENEDKTIKILSFDPMKVDFQVQHYQQNPEQFDSLINQKGFIAAINGVTFNSSGSQGDIKGIDKKGNISINYLKNNNSAVNSRFSIGIKNDGKVEIVKGGLKSGLPATKELTRGNNAKNPSDYKYFMNGGGLLFDDTKDKTFKSSDAFYKNFEKNHDKSFLANMRIDGNVCGRSVVGIKSDGKIIIATFGEGSDSLSNNKKPEKQNKGYELYQSLKSMGVVKAFLLDGSGATGMITNDPKIKTKPDKGRGYSKNASFLVIKNKL